MIDLKTFKDNAAKYLHRIMIEVQPQDVVEICERAIVAEHCVEIIRQNHQNLINELTKATREIRELTNKLDEIEKQKPAGTTSYLPAATGFTVALFDSAKVPVNTNVYVKPVQLSAEKPVGYLVRGTFFYSKDQAQNSCDHITENFENCIVEPVYLSAGQPKLTVWYGPMPESNGKTNWTALLHRADSKGFDVFTDGITIARSEYPERVLYEADFVRWIIGELPTKPDILAYDADKHSGYVEPIPEAVGQQTLSATTLELLNQTTVQIQVMPNGYAHASHRKPINLPQGFYDCLVLTDKLKQIIQDTVEHGTGFAITGTNGVQQIKQENVLAKPFAEIDYWQGNKLYCTMLEHAENLDIGDKLYLQPSDNIQRITEQDAREIIIEFYEWNLPRNDSGLLDDWIKGSGNLLLAKLNEHREPADYKVQRDLLLTATKNYLLDIGSKENEPVQEHIQRSYRLIAAMHHAIAQCEGK